MAARGFLGSMFIVLGWHIAIFVCGCSIALVIQGNHLVLGAVVFYAWIPSFFGVGLIFIGEIIRGEKEIKERQK